MGKRFLAVFFCALFLLTALFAGTVYVVDPYYQYHAPWGDLPVRLNDGRYQNAGTAKNFPYDSLIVGTSVSANFSAAQFDELFLEHTTKLIVLGGFFSDFSPALDIAFSTHKIKRLFWGIDSNILGRSEKEKTVSNPDYLYNKNPLDDIQYLLNKDVFFSDAMEVLRLSWEGAPGDKQSGGFLWGGDLDWSKKLVLASYQRPEKTAEPAPNDAFFPQANENLSIILRYVNEHPDTEFIFYFAPYSILFWDMTIRNGNLDATLSMQSLVLKELSSHSNVRIFYFMDCYDLITDLDQYGDHIHYSPDVSRLLAEKMANEKPLQKDEIDQRLLALREFVTAYDYDSIWKTID